MKLASMPTLKLQTTKARFPKDLKKSKVVASKKTQFGILDFKFKINLLFHTFLF